MPIDILSLNLNCRNFDKQPHKYSDNPSITKSESSEFPSSPTDSYRSGTRSWRARPASLRPPQPDVSSVSRSGDSVHQCFSSVASVPVGSLHRQRDSAGYRKHQ